jgi:hypothetical protein
MNNAGEHSDWQTIRYYRLHLKKLRSRVQLVYHRERPGDGIGESDKA